MTAKSKFSTFAVKWSSNLFLEMLVRIIIMTPMRIQLTIIWIITSYIMLYSKVIMTLAIKTFMLFRSILEIKFTTIQPTTKFRSA